MSASPAPIQPVDTRTVLQRLVLLAPGEAPAFMWSAAYFFFLLFSYYLLRPVRDTMGIRGDLDNLPWLWSATTLAALVISPLFAALVSRVPRRRFLPLIYRLLALSLVVFWALLTLLKDGPKNINAGYVFFVWVSVYNLLSTSVFWGFMADAFTQEQSKRLFGAIGVGGTLGAILGGLVPATLAHVIGPVNLILISAVLLEVVAQCTIRLCRRFGMQLDHTQAGMPITACPTCKYDLTGLPIIDGARQCPECGTLVPLTLSPTREPGRNIWGGFVLIAKSPYLQLMVVYMLLFTITSTFLYFEQARIVKTHIIDSAQRTRIFAWIDVGVNVLALFTQLFLTGRILTRLGVMAGLMLLPILTLLGFAGIWRWDIVAMVMGVQMVRRAMHYAIDRPTREVLYTVLGPDAKYKSKSFIDTFVYRTGDLAGAWSKMLCDRMLIALSTAGIAVAAGWSISAFMLAMWQRRMAKQAEQTLPSVSVATEVPVQSPSASVGR